MTANSKDPNAATKDEHDASTILNLAVAINNTCANNASEPPSKRQRKPVHKYEDPFMYYSHQETRMNALLLRSNDENDEQVAKESVDRKTRISFELYLSLLLDDLFLKNQYLGAEAINGPRLQSVDTSGGDGTIEELRRLFFCVDDNDTETISTQ
jgi:hypothetical protein